MNVLSALYIVIASVCVTNHAAMTITGLVNVDDATQQPAVSEVQQLSTTRPIKPVYVRVTVFHTRINCQKLSNNHFTILLHVYIAGFVIHTPSVIAN